MKVRVKEGKTVFIYGVLHTEFQRITLKDVTHSVDVDENGDPIVIKATDQFSKKTMDMVGKAKPVEKVKEKEPHEMNKKELKAALDSVGVEIPDGANKDQLVMLLEEHQAGD